MREWRSVSIPYCDMTTTKKYVCGKCNLAVGIIPADFPFVCRCGTKYASHVDMRGNQNDNVLVNSGGTGTELAQIFKELGVRPSSSCGCEAKEFEMDRVGIDGIKANRAKYIQWMRDAYGAL